MVEVKKMELLKQIHWYSAHRLHKHEGDCKNLHGHTYKMEVSVSGDINEDTGMIIDFGDLKSILYDKVHDKLDHCLLLCKDDPMTEDMKPIIEKYGLKHLIMDSPTTAENISEWAYDKIRKSLPENVWVNYVQVWETDTSSVVA